MPRDDDAILLDIAHAARLIGEFISGKDERSFHGDDLTQSAVLHQILVLGEAAKRISPNFRKAHPEVPWTDIAGMRDKLIHEYEAVDIGEVWIPARRDVPALLAWVTPLLPASET